MILNIIKRSWPYLVFNWVSSIKAQACTCIIDWQQLPSVSLGELFSSNSRLNIERRHVIR